MTRWGVATVVLGLTLPVGGCGRAPGGEEVDCSDGADNDGDGRADCEDPDCACGEYLRPTHLYVSAELAVRDGALGGPTFGGEPIESMVRIVLLNRKTWSGPADVSNTCIVDLRVEPGTAVESPELEAAGSWSGWEVDPAAAYQGTEGRCDSLDPADWPSDMAEWAGAYRWGVGVGPLDAAIRSEMGDAFTAHADAWVGGSMLTDLYGESQVVPSQYGLVFRLDDEGEVEVDPDNQLVPIAATDLEAAGALSDGYARLYGFYLWELAQ